MLVGGTPEYSSSAAASGIGFAARGAVEGELEAGVAGLTGYMVRKCGIDGKECTEGDVFDRGKLAKKPSAAGALSAGPCCVSGSTVDPCRPGPPSAPGKGPGRLLTFGSKDAKHGGRAGKAGGNGP